MSRYDNFGTKIPSGCVAWYDMQDTGPILIDKSGTGCHLSMVGVSRPGVVFGDTGLVMTGQVGLVRQFDGDDKFISAVPVPDQLQFGIGDFSISSWVWIPPQVTDDMCIISSMNSNVGWKLQVNGDRLAYILISNGTDTCQSLASGAITIGTWHHIVAVADRDQTDGLRLYVDGILITQTGSALSNTIDVNQTAAPMAIGLGTTDWFRGYVGHISVYDRVLSTLEISEIYMAGKYKYVSTSLPESESGPEPESLTVQLAAAEWADSQTATAYIECLSYIGEDPIATVVSEPAASWEDFAGFIWQGTWSNINGQGFSVHATMTTVAGRVGTVDFDVPDYVA